MVRRPVGLHADSNKHRWHCFIHPDVDIHVRKLDRGWTDLWVCELFGLSCYNPTGVFSLLLTLVDVVVEDGLLRVFDSLLVTRRNPNH